MIDTQQQIQLRMQAIQFALAINVATPGQSGDVAKVIQDAYAVLGFVIPQVDKIDVPNAASAVVEAPAV